MSLNNGLSGERPRIWLEPAGAPDRCWCEDNQWGDEGVEYVLASPIQADGLEVVFEGVAKRKLDGLIDRGWEISGYSIHKDGDHGLITTGGFVGWFSVAERNDAAARAELSQAQSALAAMKGEQARISMGWADTLNELETAEARIEALEEALREIVRADDENSGAEPSVSVLARAIDAGRAALSEQKP